MSSKLWECFLRDDVEGFQRFLANASYTSGSQRTAGPGGASSFKLGSPGTLISSSLGGSSKSKKLTGTSPGTPGTERGNIPRSSKTLSREELNTRDQNGRTLLHLIASSSKPSAFDFATALLSAPYLDIYAQDWESGWTALHRALYAGNATIAQALMARDIQDATNPSKLGNSNHQSGSLIKIKDREGYSPFDVYAATITSRDIKQAVSPRKVYLSLLADVDTLSDASSNASENGDEMGDDGYIIRSTLKPRVNLFGDEVFTFGSNKNLNLGVGDQDDRQFPERITLQRPEHLLQRFYREYQERRLNDDTLVTDKDCGSTSDLPALIKSRPIKIQSVVMSKLHTAILTNDPESNLFLCGYGPGGRLGTGDETTRFSFVCIETGGLANKKVISIALGQDHTLAITSSGEIFSWGSNKYGQLGYNLPRASGRDEVPTQKSPRQIFNPFKKEVILGAAASAIHSVVFSNSGLYTFGKNEGQLGLVDSDARSLEMQTTPRRVGASLFSTAIQNVSATDHATAVLLQNHEVWVFSHYGYCRLAFPLDHSPRFIRDSFMTTRYETSANRIVKIKAGGNTICALSSSGEVFTAQVNKIESLPTLTSTTNPSKIRNSLSSPVRVWSVKKAHMAVKDVDVGQDGSIIICTASGSAWRKEKRGGSKDGSSKDYKFARIPGLSRVVGVISNAFGAFAAVQRECDVTKEQIIVGPSTLWKDILPLSPFNSLRASKSPMASDPSANITSGITWDLEPSLAIKTTLMNSSDIESFFQPTSLEPTVGMVYTMTTLSDIQIPVHEFLLTGRSPVLRKAFHSFRRNRHFSIPDLLTIEHHPQGQRRIIFDGIDTFTLLNLAFFLYADSVLDIWHQARVSAENSSRYRQVRVEVMRLATQLHLPSLERASRLMIEPTKDLKLDLSHAINDPSFFESGDVVIELNGEEMRAHSEVICQRCPFFSALFYGRSGGRWLSSRRKNPDDQVHVDLRHIDRTVFEFVLRYMYADIEDQLFDEVRTKELDDFIDLIIDVAFVANELMIDRLAQICQKVLGKFVSTRNVCHLLNSIAPCYVSEFKDAGLEYICLNLEDLIANKLLGELDENLLRMLDLVCHDNQLASFPVSRGRNSDEYVFAKYPELVSLIEAEKRRRIDSMRIRARLNRIEAYDGKARPINNEKASPSIQRPLFDPMKDSLGVTSPSPLLKSKQSTGDLMFQMDDECLLSPSDKGKSAVRGAKVANENESRSWNNASGLSSSLLDGTSFGNRSYLDEQMASTGSPSEFQAASIQPKSNGPLSSPNPIQGPWSASVISTSKKNLKDIMSETSETRVSNLSLGISTRWENSSALPPKLSQKERKKIQQQQMQEKITAQQKAKEMPPQNPWKITTPTKPMPLPTTNGQEITSPTPNRSASKPSMTLRQTVARTPPPRPELTTTPMQIKGRSVSAATQSTPPSSKPSFSGPSTSPHPSVSASTSTPAPVSTPAPANLQPTIQSIRHIPRAEPYQTSFHADSPHSISLATILMQQQTEKDELREAATAKHNLEDIQLEQEFQEWWDKESRRVQGLPEPDQEDGGGREKPPGRGSGSGSGSARGSKSGSSSSGRKRRGKGGPQPQRNDSGSTPTNTIQKSSEASSRREQQQQQSHHHTRRVDQTPPSTPTSRRGGRGGACRGGRERKAATSR